MRLCRPTSHVGRLVA
ncbi:hypothetical protein KIPB_017292, partial [Kipferlia bialata]|eukprot:g17292.t1